MWQILCILIPLVTITLAQLSVKTSDPGLAEVDQLRIQTLESIQNLHYDLYESNDISGVGTTDTQLLQQYKQLTKNITRVESTLDRDSLNHLQFLLSYAQLETEVDSMKAFFDTFLRFQKETIRPSHELAWTDLARYYLDNTANGINRTMLKIHSYAVPEKDLTLYRKAIKETSSRVCELNQSQQQIIYQLYSLIAVAELKGYTMLNFAWMLLKIYDKGNFSAEADLLRKLYTDRTLTKVNAAREAMAEADRSLFKCDPKKWIEGENYVRLTKLLQGYIENEVNLNPDGTCRENCRYYQVTEYHGCFKQQFCAKQNRCHGKIVQCTYVDSDMNICQSPPGSDRRYDWIEYENGRVLGNKATCPNRRLQKVDSWWRYLFWHCSYCFCLCDDNSAGISDRYFNLREVTSDVTKNRVVTGVRFVKEQQVIHIQIQQGQMLERGMVNRSLLEWVPVKGFSVLDEDVVDGTDYHTMNWNARAIDLDDITAPGDHVVTGLRLRMVGTHVNLEIRATPFDFRTGTLHPEVRSIWLQNDNTDANPINPRKEVYLPNAELPTTKTGQNVPDSKHDQFLKFKESSVSTDAAQSTVPFIDSQAVESNGLVISGVGIYHRGTYHSGGLLALKLITYDFSPHMIPEQPENVA